MAVTFTGAGTAVAASGASPQAVTTTAALAIGDYLVALISYDNSGSSGADPMTGTIALTPATGALGAVASAQTGLNDPGNASLGVAARVVARPVTTAIPSGTVINVGWTGTLVVRAVAFMKVSSAGTTSYVGNSGSVGTNSAIAAPSFVTPTANNGEGVLCWSAKEYGTATGGDSDTTNGSWSSVYGTFTGATAAGQAAYFQSKVVTATATQTWNPTNGGTAADWILGCLTFSETINPAITQAAYRFYDDGTESGSTALAAQDTAHTVDVSSGNVDTHLRIRLQETAGGDATSSHQYNLQYELNASGAWDYVSSTGPVIYFDSASLTDDQATTNRLGAGTGSFVPGVVMEDSATLSGDIDPTPNNYTEFLVPVRFTNELIDGTTVRFRLVRSATTTFMTYTQVPTVNVTSDKIGFVGVSSTTYASRTLTIVTKPTGVVDGDFMLALVVTFSAGASDSPDPTAPGGWTLLSGFPVNLDDGPNWMEARLYWKVASSEGASWSWSHASASSQGTVVAYRNVDTTTPFDVTPTINQGLNEVSTATGLTTVTNNAMIVFFGHDWADTANPSDPPTGTTPTFTERLDDTLTYLADGLLATAGATGNKTQTNSNAASGGTPWAQYLIALRPTGSGSGATATPGVVALVAAVDAVTVLAERNASVSPGEVGLVVAVHAATVVASSDASVSPAAVAAVVAVDAATVTAVSDATVAAANVALLADVPAVGVAVSADNINPSVVEAVVAVPAADAGISAVATPDVVSTVVAVSAPDVSVGAEGIAPAAVATIVAVPAPVVAVSADNIAPASVDAAVAVHSATVSTSADGIAPAAVAAVVDVPAPVVSAVTNVTVTPGSVDTLVGVPAPAVVAAGDVDVAAGLVDLPVAVLAPTVFSESNATVTPAAVATVVAVPAAAVASESNAFVSPGVIATLVAVPAPDVSTSALVSPTNVALVVAVEAPTVASDVAISASNVPLVAAVPSATASGASVAEPGVVATTVEVPAVGFSSSVEVAAPNTALTVSVPSPVVATPIDALVGTDAVACVVAVPAPLSASTVTILPLTVTCQVRVYSSLFGFLVPYVSPMRKGPFLHGLDRAQRRRAIREQRIQNDLLEQIP